MTVQEYVQKQKDLALAIERMNQAFIRENTDKSLLNKKVVVTYQGKNGIEEHEAYYHGFIVRVKDRKAVYDFNKVKLNGEESNIRFPQIEETENVLKIELA